jgi:hypothetical protein
VQTTWFKRYFTGPQSDEEMIAFFYAHRAEMDRLATIVATEGYCVNLVRETPNHECWQIENKLALEDGPSGPTFPNSVFRHPESKKCGQQCMGQSYSFILNEWQQWKGTTHPNIVGWEKSYQYVPPLKSAEYFGLRAEKFPTDPIKAAMKFSYLKNTLDVIPIELDKDPEGHKEIALRHIVDGWFIKLSPIVSR